MTWRVSLRGTRRGTRRVGGRPERRAETEGGGTAGGNATAAENKKTKSKDSKDFISRGRGRDGQGVVGAQQGGSPRAGRRRGVEDQRRCGWAHDTGQALQRLHARHRRVVFIVKQEQWHGELSGPATTAAVNVRHLPLPSLPPLHPRSATCLAQISTASAPRPPNAVSTSNRPVLQSAVPLAKRLRCTAVRTTRHYKT